MKIGLVAGGTDAHRVASYNPFVALQWYLDGTTVGGAGPGRGGNADRRRAGDVHTKLGVLRNVMTSAVRWKPANLPIWRCFPTTI